jgi:hypothetical protein
VAHHVDADERTTAGERLEPLEQVEVPLRVVRAVNPQQEADPHAGLGLQRLDDALGDAQPRGLFDRAVRKLDVLHAHRRIVARDLAQQRFEEVDPTGDRPAQGVDALEPGERGLPVDGQGETRGERVANRGRERGETDLGPGAGPDSGGFEQPARIGDVVFEPDADEVSAARAAREVRVQVGGGPMVLGDRRAVAGVREAVIGEVAELEGGQARGPGAEQAVERTGEEARVESDRKLPDVADGQQIVLVPAQPRAIQVDREVPAEVRVNARVDLPGGSDESQPTLRPFERVPFTRVEEDHGSILRRSSASFNPRPGRLQLMGLPTVLRLPQPLDPWQGE